MTLARLLSAAAVILAVGACAAPEQRIVAPPVRFADLTAYKTDATSIAIDIEDRTSREYPQVGHLAPTTFEQAVRTWADRRFQLTGNSVNTLRITLREGRVTEKLLPIEKGVRGMVKKEAATEYEAALSLEVAIVDANGNAIARADSATWVSRTLLEGTTTPQKEAAWVEMISTCFDNVDRELKGRYREYMSRYISG
ncbi:MAG: hypothetical protein SFV19_07435 [Rhodospirillaceae bacterium]|nr:hypothetical protein [Rhodospirillaceae bacterium]